MSRLKVLVIGEICIDRFIYGNVTRLNPEAPTPVFVPSRIETNDGMAGNVALNLRSFDCEVSTLFNHKKSPIIKTRYVDDVSGYILFRIDENDVAKKINVQGSKVIGSLKQYDFIIISDYNKGFLTEAAIQRISEHHPYCFLDTKKVLGSWADKVHFIKINEKEFKNNIVQSNYLLGEAQTRLIVTLGSQGSRYLDHIEPTERVDVRNVAGAGDTFLAALASHYMRNKECISKSLRYANRLATTAAKHRGVISLFND